MNEKADNEEPTICIRRSIPKNVNEANRRNASDVSDASCEVRMMLHQFPQPVRIAILKTALAAEECDASMIPVKQIEQAIADVTKHLDIDGLLAPKPAPKPGLSPGEIAELLKEDDRK